MPETTIENIRSHPAFAELQKRYEWANETFPEHLSSGVPNPLHGVTGLMVFVANSKEVPQLIGFDEKHARCAKNKELVAPLIENDHGEAVKTIIAKYSDSGKLAGVPTNKQEAFANDIKTLLSILL